MQIKEFSARVVTFKLAAALEKYEMDLRALTDSWVDPERLRRIQQEFGEMRILGASLPKFSVAWVAVLVSRARLLQALCSRTAGPAFQVLQEHLAAVESLRKRCLRSIGAQGVIALA
ncbi:MAG TPA: hypothetical protein VFM98_15295 [Ramlibacter sp.]|uniref:hypothetical protein n=1 Tax=Ramlibacter sp. TaxID=1917967 RepID=UPI002D7E2B58|nr:hypothetical protein [Ramlibacter sp.]HET8746970.1 hypothetical protein [Ramlibacter sp.]